MEPSGDALADADFARHLAQDSPFRERSAEKIISMIERAKNRKKRFGLIGSDVLSQKFFRYRGKNS